MGYSQAHTLCLTLLLMMSAGVRSDLTQDIKGCEDAMSDLSSCLPFVTREAKAPDPTCCSSLKKEIDKGQTKRCLCTLVKDRDDPSLGFKVDANLAMSLPSICHVPANVSQCPELLHLPLDSADARIFKQFSGSSQNNGMGGVAASSSVKRKRPVAVWFRVGMVGGALSTWYLISTLST
ncbi:PREDICTED: protein YLS3 [Tarenaya hassleriana]|uniref:protein YLS3 n=1 Tax=Tarenaya hassleriana TaxID=28532 RepID=UPI00053C7227|nr:PREDICTED: protein YLS3 [Tarenaya hassleriana]